MSCECLSQFHAVAVRDVSLGVSPARQFDCPGHVSSYSTPLRSAFSLAVRRSVAQSVICRVSGSYFTSFAAVSGSGRWLRVTTGLQRRVFCLSTPLRSRLSLGLRSEFDVQTRSVSRLNVPPIAAVRGFRRFLRASNGSLRHTSSSSTRFSARGGAIAPFSSSTRFPKPCELSIQGELTANNGAAANCSARHGSCYSDSGVSRSVVALSHVRCFSLRATFAATAPRSAVAELGSLAVFTPALRP